MQYKVKLRFMIFSKGRSYHLSATKEITLPFVPYVGLSMTDGDMIYLIFSYVTWIVSESYFSCIVVVDGKDEYEFEFGDEVDDIEGIEDIVNAAKKNGWEGFNKVYQYK